MNVSPTKTVAISFVAAMVLSPLSAVAATDTALAPINVTVPKVLEHDYLEPDSPTNPYRVETTAQAGTEIFTEKDIQNLAPKDVFDLLDKAVGLDITYQGRKSPFFVNERGGGSFTYIIDGAILPSTSNRILQKIPMSAIEQIEIVRGSTSLPIGPSINIGQSNSGSGLNTGFIVIRTKQPKKTSMILNVGAEQSVAQPTANKESIYTGFVFGSSDFNGYVSGMMSGMNRPSKSTWFDGQNAEAKMFNAGINAGRFSAKMMVYTDSGRFEMQRGVTVAGALDTSKWYYDPIDTRIFSTDATMQWDEHHSTIASLFKTKYNQTEYSNETFVSPAAGIAKPYLEETSGRSLRHNIQYGGTRVMLGLQTAYDSGFGANTSTSYNKFDTNLKGYSASVEQKLFDGNVVLDGGYRQDSKHITNSSTSIAANGANNNVDLAPAKIYALGAKWFITPTYNLTGRYYNGSQGTMGDFDVRAQTGTLDPESQKRLETSLEAKFSKAFTPMLTWFDINIDHYKTAGTTTYLLNGATYYYYTQSDLHRQGIELLLKGKFDFGTSYKASWTHMTKNDAISSAGVTTDNNGLNNAQDLYTLAISHEWDQYRANLSAKKESGWTQSVSAMGVATNVSLGDYTRVDANIMRDITLGKVASHISIYGRNLTNDQYATRYTTGYYNDRGRTFGAELTMEF